MDSAVLVKYTCQSGCPCWVSWDQPCTQALYWALANSLEVQASHAIYYIVVLICAGVSKYCVEFVNLPDGLIPYTQKPNSECFSNQNNHVSCRNLTCVLNMSNYFKELLKSSTSLLVVYPMLVAFAEAVPLAKQNSRKP